MRVERFFLFFPPKLVSIRRGETEYGIGMIPLGGFVKITGMNPEELEAAEPGDPIEHRPGLLEQLEGADAGTVTPQSIEGEGQVDREILRRAYYNQPVWKRVAVIAAGPVVNIVLAFVLLFVVYLSCSGAEGDPGRLGRARDTGGGRAEARRPAARRGWRARDRPGSLEDRRAGQAHQPGDRQVRAHHERDPQSPLPGRPTANCRSAKPVGSPSSETAAVKTLHLPTYYDPEHHRYRLGIEFKAFGTTTASQSPAEAAKLAADKMWYVTSRTLSVIARIFEPEQRKQISGVVGGSRALNQAIGFDLHQGTLRPRGDQPLAGHDQPLPVPAAGRRAHLLEPGGEGPRAGGCRSA